MPTPMKKKLAVTGQGDAVDAAMSQQLYGVLRLLAKDHRRIETLLDYALKSGDEEERRLLWSECRCELLAHEYAEVKEVYRSLEPEQPVRSLIAQHNEDGIRNETLVGELDALEFGTDEWRVTLRLLQQAVSNHIREEESQLFPVIEQALGKPGVTAAATRFIASKRAAAERLTVVNSAPAPPLHDREVIYLPLHELLGKSSGSQRKPDSQRDPHNPEDGVDWPVSQRRTIET